jgi:uncharacterized protein with HEPN domain
MNERERQAWLAIIQNGQFARELIGSLSIDDFTEDRRAVYAVTRCLEIVSEASRRLRGAQQERCPDIPWRQIEDSGNVFRHNYEGVDERRVWLMIANDLPKLIVAATAALGEGGVLDEVGES